MRRIMLLICVLMTISACATWSTSSVQGVGGSGTPVASKPEQKSPQDIVIAETDITDRKYRVLGDISVTVNKTTIFHKDPTKEQVNEELRKEAAKLGADAVIFVRYGTVGIAAMSWGSLDGKGRAIVFFP